MVANLFAFFAALGYFSADQGPTPIDLRSDTWVASDRLGRIVPPGPENGALRQDRTVGMFYFLTNRVANQAVFDITKLLAANPANPQYGPYGSPHWWGEPWFGYYQSDDPWVIRKHMQMLANAGVDVLIFDNTNGPTYPEVYIPLCQVLEQMRLERLKVPKIAFFTGHGAWSTIDSDFYSKNLYPDLWFRWKGKPLMMAHLDSGDVLPQPIRDKFSVRESWAWTPSAWFGDGHDKWPWLDNYPQNFGWHEDKTKPEQVSVTVGQHATSSIGRSSLAQHEPPVNSQKLAIQTPEGLCFAQQFERALKIDPEFVFVTGWNEWTATRFRQDGSGIMAGKPEPAAGSFFVDEYNAEFSRDIEPARGLLEDNYYYQLCAFVRRYKGARSSEKAERAHIRLEAPFTQWNSVSPEYLDPEGDTFHRDHVGWGDEKYSDATGRNDIVGSKVAFDSDNLYFYVRTKTPLSPSSDPSWMLLFLNIGGTYQKGWLGYDFVVNRHVGLNQTSLESNTGNGYRWKTTGEVRYKVAGNQLMIKIPRSLIGIKGKSVRIDFKWADNILQNGQPSDFTLHGDAAPDDRFNYRSEVGP